MKYLRLIIILGLANFVFSCASTSVMRLRPIDQESVFDGGKEIVKQEKDGIKVVASYEGRYQQYMIFDVEVFNKSTQSMTISPKNFTFLPLDENKQNLRSEDGQYIHSYYGVEPQQQMNQIQHEMANQEAKIKRARIINTVLIVGGIVALIASSGKSSEGAWRTAQAAEMVVQVAQVKRIIDHENYFSRMDKLNRDGQMWSQENFRTTTLAPGESLRGGIFLEANSKAKFVQINYLTDKESINFLFEQWFEERR